MTLKWLPLLAPRGSVPRGPAVSCLTAFGELVIRVWPHYPCIGFWAISGLREEPTFVEPGVALADVQTQALMAYREELREELARVEALVNAGVVPQIAEVTG